MGGSRQHGCLDSRAHKSLWHRKRSRNQRTSPSQCRCLYMTFPVWGLYITINSQISYLLHDFFLLGISSNIYSQASAKSEPFQRLYPKRSKSKILSRQKALCSMYTLNRPMPVSSHLIEQSCQHQMRRGFHVWNAYAAGESYRAATGSGQH